MKSNQTIKTKIVEHLAGEAYHNLQSAIGETNQLARHDMFLNRSSGLGLDMAVLQEKLEAAAKFIDLLR